MAAETAIDESAVESEAVAEAKVEADINPTEEEEEETGAKDETELLDEDATGKTESAKDSEIVQPEEAEVPNEDLDDVFVNTIEAQSEPAELGAEASESVVQENNIGHTVENTHEDEDPVADVTDSNAQCSSVRGSVDESSVLDHGAELEEANNSFVEEDVEEEQETVDK